MRRAAFKKLRRFYTTRIVAGVLVIFGALIASAVFMNTKDAAGQYCLAHLIYVEARGMDEQAQYDVAHSVLNRVRANRSYFGGNTICGVVFHIQSGAKQFSGVVQGEWRAKDTQAWLHSLVVAENVMSGKVAVRPELRDAMYYLNPRTATPSNKHWFDTNLRQAGWSGSHLFYRDPK